MNPIVWCDIPVLDLDRAMKFYSAMLGVPVKREDFPDMSIGLLPHVEGNVGGCLFPATGIKPSAQGALIYLNCSGRLDQAIDEVEKFGGKILEARHPIGPHGFRAVVLDSEGNRIALHSM